MRARRNSMDKRRNSGDIAAGHLRAKDIVHINTSAKGLECMQRLVTPDKVTVMDFLLGLLLYGGSICIFAALLFAISPSGSCYNVEEPAHFGFDTALWISMHSFSTIGFGSIAPAQRCTAAQLIISIESFVALLVYGFISGYIVKIFLRPTSRIRFSKKLLLNHGHRRVELDEDEIESVRGYGRYKYLTFRMVREGRVQMRNVHVRMEAQYWHAGKNRRGLGGREHHKGRVVSLSLEQDLFTTIEQLQVWHRLDEHSPLWKMREHLGDHLDGVEVSVSAFDMASEQAVMMFKRYDVRDVIVNAVFDNNFAYNPKDKSGKQLQADHSKLDNIIKENQIEEPSGPASNSPWRLRAGGRANCRAAGDDPRRRLPFSRCTFAASAAAAASSAAAAAMSPSHVPLPRSNSASPLRVASGEGRGVGLRRGHKEDSSASAFALPPPALQQTVTRGCDLEGGVNGGLPLGGDVALDAIAVRPPPGLLADKPLFSPRGRNGAAELSV